MIVVFLLCFLSQVRKFTSSSLAVLVKLIHIVNSDILRSPCFAIFHSNLDYVSITWGLKTFSHIKCLFFQIKCQKVLRGMIFAPFTAHTTPLYKNCNILKFADVINVESCIFINNCVNKDTFSIFNENFKLVQPPTHTKLNQVEMVFCLH